MAIAKVNIVEAWTEVLRRKAEEFRNDSSG